MRFYILLQISAFFLFSKFRRGRGGSRYATRAFATPIFVASATPIFVASATPIFVASATPYFRTFATRTAATPKFFFNFSFV